MRRTQLFLDDEDYACIETIKRAYGMGTASSAVRYAIREIARQVEKEAERERRREKAAERRSRS